MKKLIFHKNYLNIIFSFVTVRFMANKKINL